MKSAAFGRIGLIIVSSATGTSLAHAAAPIAVDGWHYIEAPNGLQVYVCDRPDCVEGSRVMCAFDPPNSAALPGSWWKQEAIVSELLGEPSKTFSSSSIELATGRMYELATSSDGTKTYYEFGEVKGPNWRASVSSASRDEKASQENLTRFEAALKHVTN